MSTLYVMFGASGSGKSTWAQNYIKEHPLTCIVSTDTIRGELYGDENIQDNPSLVFGIAFKKANAFLNAGYDVVFDATNLTVKDRNRVRKSIHATNYVCVAMDTCLAVCLSRQNERTRRVPEKVVTRQYNKCVFPTKEEGWNEVWTVK